MAAFFWIGLGVNSNWNTVNNWSATSGGVTNASTPSSTSDVTFDGAGVSGNTDAVVSANVTVLSLTFTSGYTSTVTINTSVTLTIAGNFTDNTAHSWTVTGSGKITISASSTITSGGKIFPGPVTFSGTNTKTLSGDWTISGILTCSTSTTTINHTTAETLNCGGLTVSGTTTGTITINVNNGTWSGASVLSVTNLQISGTSTVSGSVSFNTGTLTNNSSTTTTTSSTLNIAASTTLDTAGITWNNVTLSNTLTLVLNSLLSASGTMLISAGVAITFSGTSGWTVAILSCTHSAAAIQTLVSTVTYTITTSFNAFNSRTGGILIFVSSSGGSQAKIHLAWGATCNVLASFTDIDASSGQPIYTFNGTLSNTKGIIAVTNSPSIPYPTPIQTRNLPLNNLRRNRRRTIQH